MSRHAHNFTMKREFPVPFIYQKKDGVRLTGYRQAQVLAVLEDMQGTISSDNIPKSIKENLGIDNTRGADFNKAVKALVKKELAIDSRENTAQQQVVLTEKGYQKIVELKSSPDLISSVKDKSRLQFGVSCRILEYILEESVETDENGVAWLFASNQDGKTNVSLDIVAGLDGYITEDLIDRRLSFLCHDHNYVEFIHENNQIGRGNMIINVGVTPTGRDYYEKVVDHVFEQSSDLDLRNAVDKVVDAATQGMEYANVLGDRELLKWFIEMSSAYELTEMNLLELVRRKNILDEKLRSVELCVSSKAA